MIRVEGIPEVQKRLRPAVERIDEFDWQRARISSNCKARNGVFYAAPEATFAEQMRIKF